MLKTLRVVFIAITILILTLLQVGVLPAFFGYFPSFNLFLSLGLAFCFRGYSSESLWFAFLSGIFWDLFLFSPFGLSAAFLVIFVWALSVAFRFLGAKWEVFLVFSFLSSFFWRVFFGLPSFSYLYLLGAGGDLFLASLSAFLVVPVWEKIFGKKDLQLSMGIR